MFLKKYANLTNLTKHNLRKKFILKLFVCMKIKKKNQKFL